MNNAQKIFADYRTKTGLTQSEMANAFGVSQSTVCQIEKGTVTPDAEIVLKIISKNKKKK